jgi:hypothetical protein
VQSTDHCALHFRLLKEACIPSLKSIRLIVIELCSGQGLGDADADNDADNDTADKSNPYMSPFQGDTKMRPASDQFLSGSLYSWLSCCTAYIYIYVLRENETRLRSMFNYWQSHHFSWLEAYLYHRWPL